MQKNPQTYKVFKAKYFCLANFVYNGVVSVPELLRVLTDTTPTL